MKDLQKRFLLLGALVVGLMVVIYLLASGGLGGNSPTTSAQTGNSGTSDSGTVVEVPTTDPNAPAAGTDVPRMSLEEFKALYDDPSKRPVIIDVRPKETFDEGHIEGAISFPDADVDSRVAELPKDRTVIAYCQ
jgi:hypothetical protein